MRRLFCILLLICLPLHSFAAQAVGALASGAAGLVHEFEHAEEVQHHHEDDGSVHYDDSEESLQHAEESSATVQLPLLAPAIASLRPIKASIADYPAFVSFTPDPCLDDPQRPPSFAPGLAAGG